MSAATLGEEGKKKKEEEILVELKQLKRATKFLLSFQIRKWICRTPTS